MQWLDDEVEALKASARYFYYRINAGRVVFFVGLTEGSVFLAALDAFACVEEVSFIPDGGVPTVWIADAPKVLHRCSANYRRELAFAQAGTRISRSKMFINWDEPRGLLKYFNVDSNLGIFCAEDLSSLPSWEWFSPLKQFVHLFALLQGAWLAHAASVSSNEDRSGALLVGPGGSGKSTTCAHLVQAGAPTCGDDYVLLSNEAEGVFAHAIYRTVKLMPRKPLGNKVSVFEGLRQARVAETGKTVYFLDKNSERFKLVLRMPIKQIIGLCLVDGLQEPVRLTALSYTHFAMSSHGQIPVWLDRSLSVSREIFERLPKKMIEVRRDDSGLQASAAFLSEALG